MAKDPFVISDLTIPVYQALVDALPSAVFLKDAEEDFRVKIWNQSAEQIFEIPRADILGKTAHDLWPKEQADAYLQADRQVVQDERMVFIAEEASQSKSRGTIYLQTQKIPIWVNSKIKYLLCISEDVTAQHESRKGIDFVLDSLGIGVWKWDIKSNNLEWDKNMYRLYGADPKEFNGAYDAWERSLSPETRSRAVEEIQAAARGEKEFDTTFQVVHRSGKIQEIRTKAFVTRDAEGNPLKMIGINVDRNHEAELEKAMLVERSKALLNSKLASLGEMSAGIAHEINNPLAIILGSTQSIRRHQGNEEIWLQKFETIEKSAGRLAKIVQGLKKFSRSSEKAAFQKVSLNRIIMEALTLTDSKSKRHHTSVKFESAIEVPILCDEVEIEQVLVNLINNGIDAVADLSERWISITLESSDDSAILRVRDAGKGMDEETKKKLFQPFFTTKPVGKGTGIGLSIVKGILDDHHATIELLEDSDHTCFEICFPRP